MSAPAVIAPSNKLPSRVVNSTATNTAKGSTTLLQQSTSTGATKVSTNRIQNRWKPPRKPEIQIDKTELKKKLTPLQYKVTQEKFTERPNSGEFLRLNEKGIYCCVVCGEELFSSDTKYDSGCGWPAFYDTLNDDKLITKTDLSHVGGNLLLLALNQDLARTEVTCAKCGAHLGHVFDDGPRPTGKRYCVNSASLKFKRSNGEEIICDIPTGGGCCFRTPPKSLSSTALSTNLDDVATNQTDQSNETSIASKIASSVTESTNINNELKAVDQQQQQKQNPNRKHLIDETAPKQSTLNAFNRPSISTKNRLNEKIDFNTKYREKTKSLSPTRNTWHVDFHPGPHQQSFNNPTPNFLINHTSSSSISTQHARKVQMSKEDFFKSMTNKPVLNRIKRINENVNDIPNNNLKNHDLNNNRTGQIKYNDVKSRYLDHLDSLSKKSVIKHTVSPSIPKKNINNTSTTARGVLESDL